MNELKKHIHDNANGLDYTLVNDHYLPNLTAAAPTEHPTGRWGRLHKMYLKEQHPIRYNQLLLSGELGGYLAKLDKQAEEQLACNHAELLEQWRMLTQTKRIETAKKRGHPFLMSAHKKNDTQKEGAQCSLYYTHATADSAAPHRIIFC